MIRLLAFLLRTSRAIRFSRSAVTIGLVAGLLSGMGYTVLLALISSALATDRSGMLLTSFVGLCVLVSLTRLVSQGLFEQVGVRTVFDVRLQLSHRILATPLRKLEEIGPNRLLAALSEDVTAISTALTQLPRLCMNLAIALACLLYLAWLAWPLFLATLGFMAVGIATYQIPLLKANRLFVRIRDDRDALYALFRDIIHGAKELRLHRRRRQALIENALVPTGRSIQRLTFVSNATFNAAGVWGNLLFFIALGLLLFVLRTQVEPRVLTGYTLALLYMLAPLESFLLALPLLGRGVVAAGRLDQLGLDLRGSGEIESGDLQPAPGWRSLNLVDVSYAYRGGERAESFGIGPMRLSFRPGELVFLIGGNGSGKTTLAKVLTGLYSPDSGEILLDGCPVTDLSRDAYRQMFSAIFSDFHLFRSLLGPSAEQVDEITRGYLARLRLTDKVRVEGGRLSTFGLSQGQRKRLALLNAYLEDRPIYVFDEWAADQDPQYKAIFYFEILPDLKARGKTVLVISHDDQYYGVADRLIKLSNGVIEWDQQTISPPQVRSEKGEAASWPRP